ncbi:MAG: sigma-54-dependent transcriptional regulator, partial [Arenicella sp.]
ELAVKCLQLGAFDFISKPVMSSELKRVVEQGVNLSNVTETNTEQHEQLLGESTAMDNIRQTIKKIARSQAPVHISGPSGSGKELAARQIHHQSTRQNAPFIAINCGAIPSELMESEFFGHKKGSFTGAISDKEGFFQAANHGTLFLDEVADLPLEMQVKLLRAIQEKRVRSIGSNNEEEVDIRILSATHKDLKALIQQETFREDLFFRINVIPLNMPSLSERPEDVPLLTEHIINKLNKSHSDSSTKQLSHEALKKLQEYSFPGNVRELENILERACALSDANTIEPQDLMLENEFHEERVSSKTFNANKENIESFLERTEKEAIINALEKTGGNKTKAAKLLGISFRSLRYKLTKIDLN